MKRERLYNTQGFNITPTCHKKSHSRLVLQVSNHEVYNCIKFHCAYHEYEIIPHTQT